MTTTFKVIATDMWNRPLPTRECATLADAQREMHSAHTRGGMAYIQLPEGF